MAIRNIKLAVISAFILIASSCTLLKPYQAELGQGNFVLPEQIEKLEIGQTKNQVQYLIGLPILEGESTETKWIYPLKQDDETFKHLIIRFTNNKVSEISKP
ncbi:outer membrane protein assembly factor BamE [Reinekea marina]|uniref:Outer membrane protein assembly factor BamE n=1 Tax=Reinekea marina TaxID=1310421 RepID=A0ABV7WLX9_9GAMM|nr:outer membrane protein assembly factor BamE [Reinekea marina]MDN3650692.1 outer membrane protein assembly factor BamE [Reinekea marina]